MMARPGCDADRKRINRMLRRLIAAAQDDPEWHPKARVIIYVGEGDCECAVSMYRGFTSDQMERALTDMLAEFLEPSGRRVVIVDGGTLN